MTMVANNTRRVESYMSIMQPNQHYSAREIYEMACSQLQKNVQPKSTSTVSNALAWATRRGIVKRKGTSGRYRYSLPIELEVYNQPKGE